MARIYLDEQLDTDITEMLVGYGHDAVHTYDVGNRGAPDSRQLLFAADTGRVLVTLNREDFEELHRWWLALNAWGIMSRAHSGILTTWGDIPASEWAGLVNEPSRTKPGIDQSNDAVQPTITAMAALSPALTPIPTPTPPALSSFPGPGPVGRPVPAGRGRPRCRQRPRPGCALPGSQ